MQLGEEALTLEQTLPAAVTVADPAPIPKAMAAATPTPAAAPASRVHRVRLLRSTSFPLFVTKTSTSFVPVGAPCATGAGDALSVTSRNLTLGRGEGGAQA